MTNRPDDCPPDVKRDLRRRAEYGCCRCGLPIYEYHHIIPYSVRPHYDPDDMMILCPNAHDEATDGAFTESEQRKWQTNPFNVHRGYAGGRLKINQSYCAVRVGGALLVGKGAPILVDDEPLLEIKLGDDSQLELSANLYNEDGDIIAIIDSNEWIAGSASAWDIESGHRTLTIRRKRRDAAIRLDAKMEPINLRAKLRYRDWLIDLRPTGIFISGFEARWPMRGEGLAFVNMAINCTTNPKQAYLFSPQGNGRIISETDPIRRLTKATNALLEDS